MQFLQNLLTNWEILFHGFLERNIKPLIEIVEGIEYFRHKKVQQWPKFSKIVLQRRSSKQQPTVSLKVEKYLPTLWLEVFNVLSFIQDHIIPLLSSEDRVISNSNLIACYTNVEGI